MSQKSFISLYHHIKSMFKYRYSLRTVLWMVPLCAFLLCTQTVLAAQVFTVSPLLIEHDTEGRDMFERTITLTGQEARDVRVYASVHEIKMGENTEIETFLPASMSDRSTSITSWIEITRGRLEIPAGETLEVPLRVKIHPDAPAGTYYAYVGFATGRNRDEIEKTIINGGGVGTILKLSIAEDKNEQLSLVSFVTDRFTMSSNSNELSVVVENTGETALVPEGEVIIYDTRGKEIASVLVNSDKNIVNPGERVLFTEPLPFTDRLGRNKAYLTMMYGENQAAVFDTAFYFSLPWYYLAGLCGVMLTLVLLFSLLMRRMYQMRQSEGASEVYDLPVFVRASKDHDSFDHDINLKHVSKDS